jgi:hypothetical protein
MHWAFGSAVVLTDSDWKLKILNPVVAPGDDIVVEFTFCKSRNINAVLVRQFVDSVEWALPDQQTSFVVGCGTRTFFQTVPKVLPPGKYKFRMLFTYQVNPIRVVAYPFESATFEVTKPPADRLAVLESTLYGKPSKERKPATTEKWQIERDKELRKRINELERWRLRSENP